MSWNHRVCKETHNWKLVNGDEGQTVVYAVHEVYYNKDGEVCAVTENPASLLADVSEFKFPTEESALEGLAEQVEMFRKALGKPVVDLDTIKYADMEFET